MIEPKDLPAVVSFGRSGSHWLCSLIYQWFFWGELKGIKAKGLPFRVWQNDNVTMCPWFELFGGHIFDPKSRAAKEFHPRPIIYLRRRSYDLLPSGWRLNGQENLIKDQPAMTFSEYLRAKSPVGRSAINPCPEQMGVQEALHWSQSKWVESNNFVLEYEEMLEDLDSVRDRIAVLLRRTPEKLRFPADRRVGYVVPQGRFTNDELWGMVK